MYNIITNILRKYNIRLKSASKNNKQIINIIWGLVEYTKKCLIRYVREKHNDLVYISNRLIIK